MAEGAKPQKVLIAVDGSDHANYAVKCKCPLQLQLHARANTEHACMAYKVKYVR